MIEDCAGRLRPTPKAETGANIARQIGNTWQGCRSSVSAE